MTTESFFALFCASIIAFLFGLAVNMGGYSLFLLLLPIWGFFFGFGLGVQTIQAILGTAAIATVTSWVVGFAVGAVFAVLAYLFYIAAVAIIAGSLGYGLAISILGAIGLQFGLIVWLIGIAAAIALVVITLRFNLAKWVIIIATAYGGALVIIGTLLFLFSGGAATKLIEDPVRFAMSNSPFWLIVGIVLWGIGIGVQAASTRNMTVKRYNRWDDMNSATPTA